MKRIPNLFFQTSLQNLFPRSLFFGILTTASLFTSSLIFSSHADAQTPAVKNSVNSTQITSYAQALLTMETPRQRAFDEIKKLIGGGEIPKIICNSPNSMTNLPRKVQDIAVTYCEKSKEIVERYGLTTDQFNQITVELQNNNNLKRQVYNTLIRLQKTPESR